MATRTHLTMTTRENTARIPSNRDAARHPITNHFEELGFYDRRDSEFGHYRCGPDRLPHAKEVLVARYPAHEDGHCVEIYCTAMPARFYTIRVLHATNCLGELKPGFTLCTGSSCERLAARIARAVSRGMLALRPTEAPCEEA